MLPPTGHLQFVPPRLDAALKRVRGEVWRPAGGPLRVRCSEPTSAETAVAGAPGLAYREVASLPHRWGRGFDQVWWEVEVPVGHAGAWLHWRDQGEATVYEGGTALAGIDPGHTRVKLPEGVAAGGGLLRVESICARTGLWVPGAGEPIGEGGSVFEGASLDARDEDAWAASFDLETLLSLAVHLHRRDHPIDGDLPSGFGYRPPIEGFDPLGRRILVGLNEAVDAYERHGVAALRERTRALLADLPAGPAASSVLLTGHMHLDLVWLWPERTAEFKAVHSLANALDLRSRYPELVFGQSQPAMFEAIERRDPALHGRLLGEAQAGGFEPVGAMYVESDTQLPCGEGLVRAFEIGQEGFRRLRADGRDSPIVWLPDVFGYSAALPTIMAGFGVPYFYTTKMHWSSATRIPYSSFKWRGMDGSEVLTHLSWNFYNAEATVGEVVHAADHDRQSGVHPETILPIGYGDGGGGPSDAMAERARRLADLAGVPRCGWGTIEGFFDRLAEKRDRLPTYAGEMYLEYHRGVQTTRAGLKSRFRALERALQAREAVACMPGRVPGAGEAARLTHAWKRCVFAQFHDHVPGSSIPEVYEEALPELEALAAEMADDTGSALAGGGTQPVVFNPLPVERVVELDGGMHRLPPLAAVAWEGLEPLACEPTACEVDADRAVLRNGRLRVSFNAAGEAEAMTADGRELDLPTPAGRLYSFPDHPANFDAWDIDLPTLSNGEAVRGPAERSLEGEGTHAPTLVFRRRIGAESRAEVRYRLLPGEAVVRVEVRLDWREPQTLLKWTAGTGYAGRQARYGAPFGSVLRPQSPGPLAHDAAFEVPGSRWAAVADDTEAEGLCLVTESHYGFGARDGLLHCSLVRSALETGHAGRDAGNDSADAGFECTDLGAHRFRFAFGPFSASAPAAEQPAALADALFTPVVRGVGRPGAAGLLGVRDAPSLVPAWAKPAPDGSGFTLRLHETLGRRGEATVELGGGLTAERVDLRGDRSGPPVEALGGGLHRVAFRPYQVVSLRVRRP